MHRAITTYFAVHNILKTVVLLQFLFGSHVMWHGVQNMNKLGLRKGLTMPALDSDDTFVTWQISAFIGLWQIWNMPKVQILKIHYTDSLIHLRFHVRYGRDAHVIEWTSVLMLLPKVAIAFCSNWLIDCLM